MTTPPIRLVVTGHDEAGKAIVIADSLLDSKPNPSGDALFTLVWTTATAPVNNDDPARVAFVLLDANPATVNGAPLPDIHPSAATSNPWWGKREANE